MSNPYKAIQDKCLLLKIIYRIKHWKHTKSWQSSMLLCIPAMSRWINNNFYCLLPLLWLKYFSYILLCPVVPMCWFFFAQHQKMCKFFLHKFARRIKILFSSVKLCMWGEKKVMKRKRIISIESVHEKNSWENEHQLTTYWHRQPHELHWNQRYNICYCHDATILEFVHSTVILAMFHLIHLMVYCLVISCNVMLCCLMMICEKIGIHEKVLVMWSCCWCGLNGIKIKLELEFLDFYEYKKIWVGVIHFMLRIIWDLFCTGYCKNDEICCLLIKNYYNMPHSAEQTTPILP